MLTPEGGELLSRVQIILQEVQELKNCARQLSDPYRGKLTIGAFPTLSPYLFPQILDELRSSYPEIKFYLVEEKTETLLQLLKSAKLDAAFIALPHESPALNSQLIFEEEFFLATSQSHPLSKKNSITTQELSGESLLLLNEGHCLRDQSLNICSTNKIHEHYDFQASSLETLRQMVKADIGMTLMPDCARRSGDSLTYIPFQSPAPTRKIALFWRKNSARNKIFEEISDDLIRLLKRPS
ncbi:MAG: DNA-binding transcriptional regulator OxyR [Lentisphaeraceae bacterium]|nr:DNA-binding transcriptional regulator OxyR [Lentisphaeraceae bacterium]